MQELFSMELLLMAAQWCREPGTNVSNTKSNLELRSQEQFLLSVCLCSSTLALSTHLKDLSAQALSLQLTILWRDMLSGWLSLQARCISTMDVPVAVVNSSWEMKSKRASLESLQSSKHFPRSQRYCWRPKMKWRRRKWKLNCLFCARRPTGLTRLSTEQLQTRWQLMLKQPLTMRTTRCSDI
jgi:hypothetical protein